MAAEGRVLYNYNGEYKKGLLGKKKISAKLYEDYIEGTGAEIHIGELREVPFRLNISDIKKVEIKEINDNKCIQIEYVPENEEERARGNSKLLLPNVDKIEEAKKVLYDMVDKLFQEATRKALLEREKKEGAKKFYNEKMEAYGLNGETKYHKLMDVDKQYVGFYVDKSAVGVIAVDGQNQQDGKFSIAYDKVRYFGKIENVTEKYTTKVTIEANVIDEILKPIYDKALPKAMPASMASPFLPRSPDSVWFCRSGISQTVSCRIRPSTCWMKPVPM
jgi:hypothetical protein